MQDIFSHGDSIGIGHVATIYENFPLDIVCDLEKPVPLNKAGLTRSSPLEAGLRGLFPLLQHLDFLDVDNAFLGISGGFHLDVVPLVFR